MLMLILMLMCMPFRCSCLIVIIRYSIPFAKYKLDTKVTCKIHWLHITNFPQRSDSRWDLYPREHLCLRFDLETELICSLMSKHTDIHPYQICNSLGKIIAKCAQSLFIWMWFKKISFIWNGKWQFTIFVFSARHRFIGVSLKPEWEPSYSKFYWKFIFFIWKK